MLRVVAAGGPIIKNKTFWFVDYEGTRIPEAVPLTGYTVPTAAEVASGFTNFSDMIALQSGSKTDALGRTFPMGTVFDLKFQARRPPLPCAAVAAAGRRKEYRSSSCERATPR